MTRNLGEYREEPIVTATMPLKPSSHGALFLTSGLLVVEAMVSEALDLLAIVHILSVPWLARQGQQPSAVACANIC